MNPAAVRLGTDYEDSLRAYLADAGEAALGRAYELGRAAVAEELGVIDLAAAHQAALLAVRADPASPPDAVRLAGDFLLEALGAFEMVQRGYAEARDAAGAERRHVRMLRSLSGFLADASLAAETDGARDEMLRVVAEHARELTGAECCLVTLRPTPAARQCASSRATTPTRRVRASSATRSPMRCTGWPTAASSAATTRATTRARRAVGLAVGARPLR